ncbi:MAG: GNAT family N-acetyltransferase [Solobacterium sp.]|nr:GNAT family N-acetyltransferase [Solobacterium sp.]
MEIVKLTKQDYNALYELWHSCKGMGLNSLDDTEEGISRFLERNPDTCFGAKEGKKLAGAILCGSDGRRGYIYHTAVHPDFRHHGIGSALVEHVMDALRELGIHKTALVVFARNQEGNAFWEKMGFKTREDIVYRDCVLDEMIRYDT